jgi:hypothetical protein
MATEPYDYDAAVVGMLTLRINTPIGEWLSDPDFAVYADYYREAVAAEGEEDANEYLLLSMMNTAHLAIQYLASLTGETQEVWLQRIAIDHQAPAAEGGA